jgi:general secretion pathway protein B
MSFILDALKKSELERQRQTIPGLMDAGPLERRPRFPLWAVALVALLGVNLVVLLIVLLRSTPPSTHVNPTGSLSAPAPASASPGVSPSASAVPAASGSSESTSPATAGSVSPPVGAAPPEAPVTPAPRATQSLAPAPPSRSAKHFSPMDGAPEYAPEIPADDDGGGRASPASESEAPHPGAARSGAPSAGAARAHDPVLTADEERANEEVLPTISEIDLSGQPALPDLHLDVHVFAIKPADRFVYINERKYREGAALADGLTLERIRRDGVVLNYHGLRFVLPRQQ